MSLWLDLPTFENRFTILKSVGRGGQGRGYRCRDEETHEELFLKVLNDQDCMERRKRFYREAHAYHMLSHPQLPELLCSNAGNFQTKHYKLFLVTYFIEGRTLRQKVEAGLYNLDDSCALAHSLFDVVETLHESGYVHRDIKPDNIILRRGRHDDPVLIDLGISFSPEKRLDCETAPRVELGNRFLRLPELFAGSFAKQDPRSDLTSIAGILFFAMTGCHPAQLLDQNGHPPHQRDEPRCRLKQAAGTRLPRLLSFFDRAFQHRLADRYNDVQDMRRDLESVRAKNEVAEEDVEKQIKDLCQNIRSVGDKRLEHLKSIYDAAFEVIYRVLENFAVRVEPTYRPSTSGFTDYSEGMKAYVGFEHFAKTSIKDRPCFCVMSLGSEVVVVCDEETIYRTEEESPVFGEALEKKVKVVFLNCLKRLQSR